jgi:hypothetical protein
MGVRDGCRIIKIADSFFQSMTLQQANKKWARRLKNQKKTIKLLTPQF